jgi:hypothetical protein
VSDLSTLDGLFEVFYAGVSGPEGFEWDRETQRALYLPGAPLVRLSVDDDGRPQARMMDADGHMDDTAAGGSPARCGTTNGPATRCPRTRCPSRASRRGSVLRRTPVGRSTWAAATAQRLGTNPGW